MAGRRAGIGIDLPRHALSGRRVGRALRGCIALLLLLPTCLTAQTRVTRTRIEAIACGTRADALGDTRGGAASRSVTVTPRLAWRGSQGVQIAEWPVTLGTRGVRARMIVVDIDPSLVALSLEIARDADAPLPWSLDDAPSDALVAFNAGQFTDDGPWGLVVHRGRTWQSAGRGPLSGGVVIDSAGRVSISGSARLDVVRAAGGVQEALQSYPLLLENDRPPALLCSATADFDRTHRDIRFAIGTRADGHVLLALSRYEGVGAISERVPIGPTTPEMSELMRRLGARDALMLDGGLSAQLLVREGSAVRRWEGFRRVPLAIVGRRIAR